MHDFADLLCSFYRLCAKVVLNIKWQQLPEDDQGKVNFSQTIANTHQHLVNTGFKRFELLPHIMENPWTDPTLSKIMAGDDKDDSSGSDTETEETERGNWKSFFVVNQITKCLFNSL